MPKHVVVDGSNIATEGRAMPSLKQLNEAVIAYIQDHPDHLVTVVVDATFGHRIDASEGPEFDAAIENNELVSPPAGAIGRGDAFVLTIANKAGAIILSNDSFQEFHGDYPWLFDDGRLIGGKPVPHVGWVFVPRAPVRGPTSRRAVRDAHPGKAAVSSRSHGRASKMASEPLPVPKTPPPSRGRRKRAEPAKISAPASRPDRASKKSAPVAAAAAPASKGQAPTAAKQAAINELLPFLSFVEAHPVGSAVEATPELYSSHGAYVRVDDVRAYVPLRFLADPAPRSARDVLALGHPAPFIVVSFNAPRRGIDLAKPGFEPSDLVIVEPVKRPAKKAATRGRLKVAAEPAETVAKPIRVVAAPGTEVEPAPARKAATRAPTKLAAEKAATEKAAGENAEKAAAEPPVAPPVKRTRQRAAPPVVAPAPASAPAPAAKRVRQKAAPPVVDGAPAPELQPVPAAPPAKKAAKRARAAAATG